MKIQKLILLLLFVLAPQVLPAQSLVKQAPPTTDENIVIAGRGWSKVILGTPKSEIEKILGTPDSQSKYMSFYGKSGIYVYYASNQTAGEISFETTIGTHPTSFKGTPDKKLKWGASSAEVVKAYGSPLKKRLKDEQYQGVTLSSIIYANAEFYFAADKLVRINVFDGNNRLRSFQPGN